MGRKESMFMTEQQKIDKVDGDLNSTIFLACNNLYIFI